MMEDFFKVAGDGRVSENTLRSVAGGLIEGFCILGESVGGIALQHDHLFHQTTHQTTNITSTTTINKTTIQ